MDILSISLEIIGAIVDFGKWVTGKTRRGPKTASPRAQEVEWDTTSSLLSIMLKPLKPFLTLFTNHSIVLLALLGTGGLMVELSLDKRIGALIIGIIFALAGAGNLATPRKETDDIGCAHYLAFMISACILLFGLLVAMGAVLLMIVGRSIDPAGM